MNKERLTSQKVVLRKRTKEEYQTTKKWFPTHKYELLVYDDDGYLLSRTPGSRHKLFIEAAGMGRLFADKS